MGHIELPLRRAQCDDTAAIMVNCFEIDIPA